MTEQIRYGVYGQTDSVAGMTVAQVRQRYAASWGIPSHAVGYLGVSRCTDNYVIQPGETITFHRLPAHALHALPVPPEPEPEPEPLPPPTAKEMSEARQGLLRAAAMLEGPPAKR